MSFVTRIIFLSIPVLLLGCSKEAPKSHPDFSSLPKKVEFAKPGKVDFITPKALLDSLNRGAKLNLFFIEETTPDNPAYIVDLPGMKRVKLGEIFDNGRGLPTGVPVYFICLYGDDSKRLAGEMAKRGHDCFYLDGGSFRLYTEMQKNHWPMPRP